MILYMHNHASPVLNHVNAAEHDSQCTSFPTPNDVSLTFIPNWLETTTTVFGRNSKGGAPKLTDRRHAAVKLSNAEVVLALLYVWSKGPLPIVHDIYNFEVFKEWEHNFGSTKMLWSELGHKIKSHDPEAEKEMLGFWPKE